MTAAHSHPAPADLRTGGCDRSRYEIYRRVEAAAAPSWSLETIVPGGRLWGANGIQIAPDGRLWIAEVAGNQVSRWDPCTDQLDLVAPMDGPIATPDDVAFDHAGLGYITTMHAGEVWAVALDGTLHRVTEGIPNNNGIAVDHQDRLFVDQMMSGGRLLELDRSSGTTRVVAEGLEFPSAFAEGPDSRLYVQEMRVGRVLAIDPSTGRRELVAEGFDVPTSVRFDHGGDLVVTEAGSGTVTVTHLASGDRRIRARGDRGLDNCCVDRDGCLYVSNFASGSILRFPAGGSDADMVVAEPALVDPCGLAVWDDRSVLVSDHMGTVRVGLDGTRQQVTILQDHRFIEGVPLISPSTRTSSASDGSAPGASSA